LTKQILTPQMQLKLLYLREALRSGKVKYIHMQDFRKDFVSICENAQKGNSNYAILQKARIGVMVTQGEVFPVLLEVLDFLTGPDGPFDLTEQ